jgi:hypothetical protein
MEPPQGGVSNGDFAQDEVGFPSTSPLVPSEVEGHGRISPFAERAE